MLRFQLIDTAHDIDTEGYATWDSVADECEDGDVVLACGLSNALLKEGKREHSWSIHVCHPTNSDYPEGPTLDVRHNADLVRFVVDHTTRPAGGWATKSSAFHLHTAILCIYHSLVKLSSQPVHITPSENALSVTVMIHHYSAEFHYESLSNDELCSIGCKLSLP